MLILLCRVGLGGNLQVALAFLRMGEKQRCNLGLRRISKYSHTQLTKYGYNI